MRAAGSSGDGRRSRRRRLPALLGLLAFTALLGGAAAPSAGAGAFEEIHGYDVAIVIEESGSLLVTETIEYDFGTSSRHGIFRNIPVRFDYRPSEQVGGGGSEGSAPGEAPETVPDVEDTDRVYEVDILRVEGSEGTPDQYETSEFRQDDTGYLQIKIGDPDTTITGNHTYTIEYRVRGALNGFEDHDELYWNAIGAEWPLVIGAARATVQAPADITRYTCFTGPFGSTLPCESSIASGTTATFAQNQLFPYNALTVVVAIPKGVIPPAALEPILEERWTVGRAFEVTPLTGGVAGGILLFGVGGYVAAFSRFGRDRRFKGGAVDQAFGTSEGADEVTPLISGGPEETPVEFVPPDDLRPGQVGTLVDFHAHPLDVTATIVDLAVRKYLRIEEVDTESSWLKNDWRLTKLKEPDDGLKDYERQLLQGLFQGRDDGVVELSELKYKFANRMNKVRKALEEDAKTQGWWVKDPSQACFSVGCLGLLVLIAGVVITGLLAAFTHLGLIGIPIVLLGLVILISGRWAPARSAKGSAVLRRVNGFRRFIEESEKERAQFAERKNLFSEYLPYAIVFGATDKWARAFAGLDGEPPDVSSWYVSSRPFHVTTFSSSITGFSTTTAGTLASSPPSTSGGSGFSGGGGSSGGGGGGGGGGSW